MKFLSRVLPHACIIFSVVVAVLLVLDGYNPAMNFLYNDMARAFLWTLCACSFVNALCAFKR